MKYDKNKIIQTFRTIINEHKDSFRNKTDIKQFKLDLEDALNQAFKLEYSSMFDSEGTQVTDIAKKEGYPIFKKGKQITTPDFTEGKIIQEDESPKEALTRLQQEEQDAIDSYDKTKELPGISDEVKQLLDHIKEEELEHYLELRSASQKLDNTSTN